MKLDLILKDIPDVYSRENFTRLLRYFKRIDLLDGDFEFFEIEINQSSTIIMIPHGLTFIPQDIWVTSVEGDYNFYPRYDLFDRTNIAIYVSGPCKLRFFAGAFKEQSYGRKVSAFPFVPPSVPTGTTISLTSEIKTATSGVLSKDVELFNPPSAGSYTLPSAFGRSSFYYLKNLSNFQVIINADGGEFIDGSSTFTFLAGAPDTAAMIFPSGGNWYVF